MINRKIIIAFYLAQVVTPAFAIEPIDAINEANEAIIQGDLDRARVVLEDAINESPDSLSLYNALGRVFTIMGNLNDAERVLKVGIIEYSNASQLFDNLLKVNELRVSERYRRALGIKEDGSVNHVLKVAEAWEFSPEVISKSGNLGTIAVNTISIPNDESVAIVPSAEGHPVGDVVVNTDSNAGAGDDEVATIDQVATTTVDSLSTPEAVEAVIGGTQEELEASTPTDDAANEPSVDDNAASAAPTAEEEQQNVDEEKEAAAASEALTIASATIENWRTAWSNRDADAYVKTYTADYSPSDDMSHNGWVNDRKRNFSSKDSIEVAVTELEANAIDDNRIRVRFTQRYQSNNYKDRVVKRITLLKSGDDWLIEQEISSPID